MKIIEEKKKKKKSISFFSYEHTLVNKPVNCKYVLLARLFSRTFSIGKDRDMFKKVQCRVGNTYQHLYRYLTFPMIDMTHEKCIVNQKSEEIVATI